MKRFLFSLIAVFVLVGASGCVSAEAKKQVVLREAEAARWVQLMDSGKTTADQDKEFIRQTAAHWTAFRESLGVAKP